MATQGCPRFSRSVAVRENVQCSAAERCWLGLSRSHRGAGTARSRCAVPVSRRVYTAAGDMRCTFSAVRTSLEQRECPDKGKVVCDGCRVRQMKRGVPLRGHGLLGPATSVERPHPACPALLYSARSAVFPMHSPPACNRAQEAAADRSPSSSDRTATPLSFGCGR